MNTTEYELLVLVNDKPVKEYHHNGKCFVEAKKGTEYTLKLKNNSSSRVMAVFSVDGVDVLKGEAADNADSGYIVNAYSTLVVKGFRIDNSTVAAFKFDEGNKSYASIVEQDGDVEKAKKNPSKNNGVIGVRVWKEKVPFTVNNNYYTSIPRRRESPRSFPSYPDYWYGTMSTTDSILTSNSESKSTFNSGPLLRSLTSCSSQEDEAPDFNVGTAWGSKVTDKVIEVSFSKSDIYTDLTIFYLDRDEMIKYGIEVDNVKKVSAKEFPKAFNDKGYCKIPSGWPQ